MTAHAAVPPGSPDQALVLVGVGTDRHRFDRLMGWLENWYTAGPPRPRLLVQYGYSRPPALPGAVDFLDHDKLQQAMIEAAVVVTHGGPATIAEARRHGHLPLVVPRDPALGEHVDDHQLLFAQRLDRAEMIVRCDTEPTLTAALDAALADPATRRIAADPTALAARAEAVARVGAIVEELERKQRPATSDLRRVPTQRRPRRPA